MKTEKLHIRRIFDRLEELGYIKVNQYKGIVEPFYSLLENKVNKARQDERKKLIRREIRMECLECGEPLPLGTHINLCDFHREKFREKIIEESIKEVKSQNEK